MTAPERIAKGLYWDRAWSLVSGCTPVSEGCQNCWSARETHMRAEHSNKKVKKRNEGLTEAGWFNGRIRLNYELLEKPLHRNKPTVYAVWNDLFHEDVPFGFINHVFHIIDVCPEHTFLILTKRPDRMKQYFEQDYKVTEHIRSFGLDMPNEPRSNVWLGVTAENQQRADERIPVLLQIPAAVRFVSVEPMLGPVDLELYLPYTHHPAKEDWHRNGYHVIRLTKGIRSGVLDWVICGGETGPGARPMHPDWVRSLRDQCQAAGVPFFFKQWGDWAPRWGSGTHLVYKEDGRVIIANHEHPDAWKHQSAEPVAHVGKRAAGRLLDGIEHNGFPDVKGR